MFSEPAIPVNVWYTLATLMPQGEYSFVDYQRWGPHPSETLPIRKILLGRLSRTAPPPHA
jgi:hypothetical protein